MSSPSDEYSDLESRDKEIDKLRAEVKRLESLIAGRKSQDFLVASLTKESNVMFKKLEAAGLQLREARERHAQIVKDFTDWKWSKRDDCARNEDGTTHLLTIESMGALAQEILQTNDQPFTPPDQKKFDVDMKIDPAVIAFSWVDEKTGKTMHRMSDGTVRESNDTHIEGDSKGHILHDKGGGDIERQRLDPNWQVGDRGTFIGDA